MLLVTKEGFEEWLTIPLTVRFMKKLREEREQMKEGLVNEVYENPEVVKGMCRAIALILNMEYEDLYDQRDKPSRTQDSNPA
jgi:hypothetical protein